MKSFSQRQGLKPVSQVIQTDSMSDDLRNSLWNCLQIFIWDSKNFLISHAEPKIFGFSQVLWFSYLRKPIDTIPRHPELILVAIRNYFFKAQWNEVYDFLEAVIGMDTEIRNDLVTFINHQLEREMSAYRVIGETIVPITDGQERKMLENALVDDEFEPVKLHLESALSLLSKRDGPDYRNSIKESISAVESMAKIVTGNPKSTLGDAIRTLKKDGILHATLLDAFNKLYGYTSDEGGIRHAMMDSPALNQDDAKYFLLTCTSFVNYLKAAYAKKTAR